MANYQFYTDTLERGIAKIYLFCLPFRMIAQLQGINSIMHGAAAQLDFIFNALGILIYVIKTRGNIYFGCSDADERFKYFVGMVFALNISSLIMATVIQITIGDYAGESAYSGILGMEIYFFQYIFIIAYSKRIFHILSEEEIKRILELVCTFLLILGYLQLIAINFSRGLYNFLNNIDILGIIMPGYSMWKLSLTGSEGASAGTIYAVLVLPFLFARFLETHSSKYIAQIILWIPVLVMMKSTSAYLMAIADTIVFLILLNQIIGYSYGIITVLVILSLLIVLLMTGDSDVIQSLLPSDIRYLIFEKALDLQNGSTVSRLVPFVTNWKIFLQYPFFGCGNGLQGYFYITFLPEWAKNVAGSDIMTFYETAQHTIVNGGVFFPGLLSGYGIVGCSLIVGLIVKIINAFRKIRSRNFFINFFRISIFAIIVCGFQSEFAGNYIIWFVISIAFVDLDVSTTNEIAIVDK